MNLRQINEQAAAGNLGPYFDALTGKTAEEQKAYVIMLKADWDEWQSTLPEDQRWKPWN